MASSLPQGKHSFTQCMALLSLVSSVFATTSTTPPVRFEAAFQGECGEDSPCEQLCFDLHDGTYECSCRKGYVLSSNGYSCLDDYGFEDDEGSEILPELKDLLAQQRSRADARRYFFMEHGNFIHRQNNRYKRRRKPGVHLPWSTSPARLQVIRTENSLQTTTPLSDSLSSFLQPMNTVTITTPPSQNQVKTCDDMQCENGGICELSLRTKNARCMCPLGKHGLRCDKEIDVYQPKFHGQSYLSFPVLKDAARSVLIVLEFRPESFDGILLYSGEAGIQGDYLAIVLNKGFMEFRFDCGSGEAILRSNQPVILYSWNKVSIYRERWDAWMQLNNGKQVHGQSQGLYSKISFQKYLYLGGVNTLKSIKERLNMETGFNGCVDYLKINDKLYDFSLKAGDVIGGFDVDECDIDGCNQVVCLNGGKCISSAADEGACVCALGFTGELCETAIEVMVPFFNNSFLQYEGLEDSVTSFLEINLIFKPYSPWGALLYNGDKLNNSDDFISVNLVNSHIEFRFDLGTGPVAIRCPQPLILGEWHSLHVTRTGRQAVLQVDDQRPVFGLSPGAFTQLTLSLSMFLGGIPDLSHVSPSSGISTSFTGCIQKFVINNQQVKLLEHAVSGRNIANCRHPCLKRPCYNGGSCQPNGDSYNCKCPNGYTGTNCQKEDKGLKEISETIPIGTRYYFYIDSEIFKRIHQNKMDLSLNFKTSSPNGLILWIGQEDFSCSKEFLSVGIADGYLLLSYRLDDDVKVINSSARLDDGCWHLLQVIRNGNDCLMRVDDVAPTSELSLDWLAQNTLEQGHDNEVKIMKGGSNMDFGLIASMTNFTISIDCRIRLIIHNGTGRTLQPCT